MTQTQTEQRAILVFVGRMEKGAAKESVDGMERWTVAGQSVAWTGNRIVPDIGRYCETNPRRINEAGAEVRRSPR